MIDVKGNLSIGTYNEKPVTVISQANTQNNTQVNVQPQVVSGQPEEPVNAENHHSPIICFNNKKGNKVNLFRVIEAMRVHGFFKDAHGGSADQNDVFAAFGQMLGEDFSEYTRDLSQGKVHNAGSTVSGDIFDSLKKDFLDSINEER